MANTIVSFATGTRRELERLAARQIAELLRTAVRERGRASLALPGGRSIAKLLQFLLEHEVPWRSVDLFPADERCLPAGHEERNWRIISAELLQPLVRRRLLPAANCHEYVYQPETADWGLAALNHALEMRRGADKTVRLDVVVLGAGEDGHVASLFPQAPELASTEHGFLRITDSPKPPPRRITLSPAAIRSSETALVLFFGAAKRDAARAFRDPAVGVDRCPAKLVLSAHRYHAFADSEALSDGGTG